MENEDNGGVEPQKKRRGRPPKNETKKVQKETPKPEKEAGNEVAKTEKPVLAAMKKIDYGFDYLDEDVDITSSLEDALITVVSARKNQSVSFKRLSDVRQHMLPIRPFSVQYLTGMYGLPTKSLIEIIGAEGLGKTSLTLQMLAWAMDVGCPALYIDCENKTMTNTRALRCMHTDPKRALLMLDRLRVEKAHSLEQMEQIILDYVAVVRGARAKKDTITVPKHVPIVIAIDPWSKLLSPEEAAGFHNYADNLTPAQKVKFKRTADSGNFGHAKFAAGWTRRLKTIMDQENITFIVVHHQMDDIGSAMKAKPGMGGFNLPDWVGSLQNKTHIGGRSMHQTAAIQMTLARGRNVIDDDKKLVGKEIYCSTIKNSFGPEGRRITFMINMNQGVIDSPTYLEPALNFDYGLAKLFADHSWLNAKVSDKRYTCDDLNVRASGPEELCAAFYADEHKVFRLGELLEIDGYTDLIENLKQSIKNAPEETPPPPPDIVTEEIQEPDISQDDVSEFYDLLSEEGMTYE